jgi:hypothetical protein
MRVADSIAAIVMSSISQSGGPAIPPFAFHARSPDCEPVAAEQGAHHNTTIDLFKPIAALAVAAWEGR